MRIAHGFKKKYFSLQAITATVSAIKIAKNFASIDEHLFLSRTNDAKEDSDPPETDLSCASLNTSEDSEQPP
ncbi:MAG: hypothetical protein RL154_313 [Pseudomonadota bacterium]|jgi:hypothetical protein